MQENRTYAYAWYRPDSWRRIRDAAADPDKMDPTFAQWRRAAQRRFDELRRQGIAVEKILIDPDALFAFAEGRPITTQVRAEFAITVQMRAQDKRH